MFLIYLQNYNFALQIYFCMKSFVYVMALLLFKMFGNPFVSVFTVDCMAVGVNVGLFVFGVVRLG